MRIHRGPIGLSSGHDQQGPTPVEAYTLETQRLSITVWTYGATLVEVLVPDRYGRSDNVVLRHPDLRLYELGAETGYLGATMGRYARCIRGARFINDGIEYRLDRNWGRHHIHGGRVGFDRFVWKAEPKREPDRVALHLHLESHDGDQGYPGDLAVETIYSVDSYGRLGFEHRATSSKRTVVALTNHAYWNLKADGTINDHQLAINANRLLMVDRELIPTGVPVPIAGTQFDYRSLRSIGTDRLDHCFVLDDPTWAVKLFDPVSGRAMRILTDQPGLQAYSGDGLSHPRNGLCLQTGTWPDSPNRPDFPSSRLDPGDTYVHRTTHEFSTVNERAPLFG